MNGRFVTAMVVLALGALVALYGCSNDGHDMGGEHHEGMEHQGDMGHGEMSEHDATMQKQHDSMMRLQQEWQKARSAIEEGSPSEAVGPAMQMEDAAGMQDDFMLHKNAENRDEFLAQSREFKSLVMRFRATAETGDTNSLKELAPRIDEACNGCHQAFR